MQVWTERIATVAGMGKQFAAFHRVIAGSEIEVGLEAFIVVLILAYALCDIVGETVEMGIDSHEPIVHNIQRHSIPCRLHLGTANISVGYTLDGFSHHTTGLEVEPGMEMVGTKFGIACTQ